MVLEYEFETQPIGYDEKHDEEYYDTETFEYEPTEYDEERVARRMVMLDAGLNEEQAKRVVDNILVECGFLQDYLETDIDFVKSYFKNKAESLFLNLREN